MARLPTLGPRGEGWVLLQVVLIVLIVAAASSLGPDWSGPRRSLGVGLGVVLLPTGVVLIVRGVRDLGSAMTPVPRPRDAGELIDTGVYGVMRHPIYSGLLLVMFGGAIVQASLIALGLAACLAVVLYLKSTVEERWLEARYAGYASYRARTGRFLPRLSSLRR
jgi:protein-S-isoprenylcysteine O-methyltransferase Ste14